MAAWVASANALHLTPWLLVDRQFSPSGYVSVTSRSKSFLAPALALGLLWLLCSLVSLTGGLPEPLGSSIGQTISRTGHAAFLVGGLAWILLSRLAPGESRLVRVTTVVLALIAYVLLVVATKHVFYLPRPGQPAIWVEGSRGSGFPSGHTVPAFEVACLLAAVSPRATIPAFAMAILIGYSRVEVTAHYAYQVVLSAALGILAGTAIALLREKISRNFLQKELAPPHFS
jgi:membrane-associated phospholipid phosphatase